MIVIIGVDRVPETSSGFCRLITALTFMRIQKRVDNYLDLQEYNMKKKEKNNRNKRDVKYDTNSVEIKPESLVGER